MGAKIIIIKRLERKCRKRDLEKVKVVRTKSADSHATYISSENKRVGNERGGKWKQVLCQTHSAWWGRGGGCIFPGIEKKKN